MALSYKILSVAGIDIELHVTFLAFIAGLLLFNASLALLLMIVFLFVTIHELFHSLVAISKGIKVSKIVLLPIGGMSVMNISDIKPLTEIQMSVAGPLFNFLMCYLLLGLMSAANLPLANAFDVIQNMNVSFALVVYYSFYANLLLGTFNLLLPAFPLDGGRIFRALLALRIDYLKATRIARNVSLFIAAFLFMLAFLSSDLWIMIIAVFIVIGAVSEYAGLEMHESLRGISVKDVMSRDYIVVKPDDKVVSFVSDAMRF
ncbi:MAG: site-2 protease family protein, partial [archaeon]